MLSRSADSDTAIVVCAQAPLTIQDLIITNTSGAVGFGWVPDIQWLQQQQEKKKQAKLKRKPSRFRSIDQNEINRPVSTLADQFHKI